jgi:hypothetical protein
MSVARESKPVEPAAPFDPWDSPYWDLWHYEISDPCEVAELERAELERCQDLVDALPDPWPTAEEMAEYDAEEDDDDEEREAKELQAIGRWLQQVEASRDFYRRNGSFGDWLTREGGPRS